MRILITGAGRAIGAATATGLSRAGHEVVATARDVSTLDDLEVALRLPLDVTDPRSVAAALDGDRTAAGAAFFLDPLAGRGGLGPTEAMIGELLSGTAAWLPQFESGR